MTSLRIRPFFDTKISSSISTLILVSIRPIGHHHQRVNTDFTWMHCSSCTNIDKLKTSIPGWLSAAKNYIFLIWSMIHLSWSILPIWYRKRLTQCDNYQVRAKKKVKWTFISTCSSRTNCDVEIYWSRDWFVYVWTEEYGFIYRNWTLLSCKFTFINI